MTKKIIFTLSLLSLAACQPKSGEITTLGGDVGSKVTKVNKENYLSGKQFCETYREITSQENGRFVSVPKSYDGSLSGSLEIYTWTPKPFDPNKPTVVILNGGPGQNSHDTKAAGNFQLSDVNELNFDQRGLGCSAPETYEEYSDAVLYSTKNTIQDMEMIRKAYNISTWSVYGISYGTIPATQYSSLYSDRVRSTLLEGVIGDLSKIHLISFKVEKANLLLKELDTLERQAFDSFIRENSADTKLIVSIIINNLLVEDFGLTNGKSLLKMIFARGQINRAFIQRFREILFGSGSSGSGSSSRAQGPSITDDHVLNVIYCNELNYRERDRLTLDYSTSEGFKEVYTSARNNAQVCRENKATPEMMATYELSKYPLSKPVYYFQGAHDGATLAAGARTHWRTLAKGPSYFMLAQRGGHNPLLTRLGSSNKKLQQAQQFVLTKAILGAPIASTEIAALNTYASAGQNWSLFTDPSAPPNLFEEWIGGIRKSAPHL